MSAAYQYYQPLPSLEDLTSYLQQNVCSSSNKVCRDQIAALQFASAVDFDFDAISHALKITAVWAHAPGGGVWSETIRLHSSSDSVEVGILNMEKATEPEELSLGGFLTVLGEDGKPSKTVSFYPLSPIPLTLPYYRPDPLLVPFTPPPSSPIISNVISHQLQATHRPASNSAPHLPSILSHAPLRIMFIARLPHPTKDPLHRPLPALRPPLPLLTTPQRPAQSKRGDRPRSSSLGD